MLATPPATQFRRCLDHGVAHVVGVAQAEDGQRLAPTARCDGLRDAVREQLPVDGTTGQAGSQERQERDDPEPSPAQWCRPADAQGHRGLERRGDLLAEPQPVGQEGLQDGHADAHGQPRNEPGGENQDEVTLAARRDGGRWVDDPAREPDGVLLEGFVLLLALERTDLLAQVRSVGDVTRQPVGGRPAARPQLLDPLLSPSTCDCRSWMRCW